MSKSCTCDFQLLNDGASACDDGAIHDDALLPVLTTVKQATAVLARRYLLNILHTTSMILATVFLRFHIALRGL